MSNPYHDDPRLTAYALGELEGDERREFERLLAESPAARAAVDDIRGIAVEITAHLRTEPMPALTSRQRSVVMSGPQPSRPSRSSSPQPARSGKSVVIAAACLMLLAAGWIMSFSEKPGNSGTSRRSATTAVASDEIRSMSLDGQPVADFGREATERKNLRLLADGRSSTVLAAKPAQDNGPVSATGLGRPGESKGGSTNGGTVHSPIPQPTSRLFSSTPGGNRPALNAFSGSGSTAGLVVPNLKQQVRMNLGVTPSYSRFGYYYKSVNGTAPWRRLTSGDIGGRAGVTGWNKRLNDFSESEFLRKSGRIDRGEQFLYESRFGSYSNKLWATDLGVNVSGKQGEALLQSLKQTGNGKAGRQGQQQQGGQARGKKRKPIDERVRSRPVADIDSAAPATKNKGKSKPAAVEWFAAKDVKTVREQVVQQFDRLAMQHPKRELAILRVKTRLSDRLQGLERQVALAEGVGQRIPAVEGRVIVGEAVRQEVRTLDVDGDGRADFGSEGFDAIVENSFLTPLANPLSTFSIDVDTASYSNVRRYLDAGALPPRNAVRVEEFVNYFHYDYPQPTSADPFSVTLEAGVCPWNTKHRLVLIGLKGREIPNDKRPPANLVFLIDVSGSMQSANRLPLVKIGLEMLVDQLRAKDRVSIVTYSNTARTVLEPTPGDRKNDLLTAIHSLNANGSTNGAAGIQMAYDQAQKAFTKEGSNRVILCTDGDFNVGVSSDDALVKLIQEKAKSKVFLSVFGFGMGNTKHAKLEKIADKGNGHYAYIDKFQEAKKVFVEEMSGTLYTIAKDVKIQVEFNPARVVSYRLVGYENRLLAAQDFNNDKKDAGEIGAGHTVTALYEIVPTDAKSGKPAVDDLKYQKRVVADKTKPVTQEVLTVKLRYKQPTGETSTKIEFPLKADAAKKAPSQNFDFASAVAMYGLLLRDSKYAGNASLELVRELAAGAMGKDPEGRRSEFVKLVQKTESFVASKLGKPIAAGRPGRK
jgi:Ca-activated chloride channel homolog